MSSDAQLADKARESHLRIAGLQFLRHAPALKARLGLKAVVLEWCGRKAMELRSSAWRMLGEAILFPPRGASLIVWVSSRVDLEAAVLIAHWLTWHRRQQSFSAADLRVSKKESKVRVVWNTVRRGSGVPPQQVGAARAPAVSWLSERAAVQLSSLRVEGRLACRVGRTPLHFEGELPPAPRAVGHIGEKEWVTGKKVAMSEEEVMAALRQSKDRGNPRRRFVPEASLGALAGTIRRCGGAKVLLAHKLLAVLHSKEGREHPGRLDLRRLTANTLTANPHMVYVQLRLGSRKEVVAERLNAQDWATLMGVPLGREHRLRVGLRAVSDAVARGIVGQAIHFEVAVQILLAVGSKTGFLHSPGTIQYASLLSGIDFVAAALENLVGDRWRFTLAAEKNASVGVALRAAWGTKLEQITGDALDLQTERALRGLRGSLDVLMISFRCAPWSTANTMPLDSRRRMDQLERALEEIQALLQLVRVAVPRVVLIECVAGVMRRGTRGYWERVQGMLQSTQGWQWSWQMICPRDTLGGWVPRRRLWIVGSS